MVVLKEPIEFEWDEGNKNKNERHGVTAKEIEKAFFDSGKVIFKDVLHSQEEERYIALGKTDAGRLLYTVFTMRKEKVHIISSRDINKKEVRLYEKKA